MMLDCSTTPIRWTMGRHFGFRKSWSALKPSLISLSASYVSLRFSKISYFGVKSMIYGPVCRYSLAMVLNVECMASLPVTPAGCIPYIIISLACMIYLPYLYCCDATPRNHIYSRVYIARTVCCMGCLLAEFCRVVVKSVTDTSRHECPTIYSLLSLSMLVLMTILCGCAVMEHNKGILRSPILSISLLLLLASRFPHANAILYNTFSKLKASLKLDGTDWVYISCVTLTLCVTFMCDILVPSRWYRRPNPRQGKIMNENPSPGSNLLGQIFFIWLIPSPVGGLVWKEPEKAWRGYNARKRWIMTAIKVLALPALPSLIGSAASCFLNLTIILNLRDLIQFVDSGDMDDRKGVYLCVRLLIQGLIFGMCFVPWYYTSHHAAARLRSLTGAIIIEKFLKLTPASRRESDTNALSLLTLDVHKISLIFSECNIIHLPIFYCPPAMVVLWQALGPSCLVGVAFIILIVYFNTNYLRRKIQRVKASEIEIKTKRVKVLTSVLTGIKVIKSYAWEEPFKDRIMRYRSEELKLLRKAWLFRIMGLTLSNCSPFVITVVMLLAYLFFAPGRAVTADRIFIVLAVVSRFRFYMGLLPIAAATLSQGIVSLKRLFLFMELEEEEKESKIEEKECITDMEYIDHSEEGRVERGEILIKDGSFCWTEDGLHLQRINLHIRSGELVGIVGRVGCGKSTLLSAILGEISHKKGQVQIKGRVGYVPQDAWILNATIRDNIVFGQMMDSARYERVLESCALLPDLEGFPLGDQTEVGERGVTLSGGQKQRISLARAVYSEADIYLLDDPLSAVDATVAQHIYTRVIGPGGLLADTTRVFVTHAVEYIQYTDRVLSIEEGQIHEVKAGRAGIDDKYNLKSNDKDTSDIIGCSPDFKDTPKDSALMAEEFNIVRMASWRTAFDYLLEFNWKLALLLVLGVVTMTTCVIRLNLWVSSWSDDWKIDPENAPKKSPYRLGIFVAIGLAKAFGVIFTLLVILMGTLSAATNLHQSLLARVFQARPSFFDSTPFGRIINWFTRDFDDIDENLAAHLWTTLDQLSDVLVLLVMVYWISPFILLAMLPFLVTIIFIQRLYSVYARDMMRIEGASRSPVFSYFREVLLGVVSIRAFRQEETFCKRFYSILDRSTAPFWHIAAAKGFMMITTVTLAGVVNFGVCLAGVLYRHHLDASFVAATMYVAFTFLLLNHKLIQAIAEVERSMISVERVSNYKNIPVEESGHPVIEAPAQQWPTTGKIEFIDYNARYKTNLPLVLNNINLTIEPGTKVGIVGRTGAGKTSLTYALLCMFETTSGQIKIDNKDISELPISGVRSGITVISQDPVLFDVSIRDNLDPHGGLTDGEIWEALERSHLKQHISSFKDGIYSNCDNLAEQFSVGQRQLFCLARALLRRSRIIVLDEPTASVDVTTDDLVQKMLREHFTDCTLLTIAHRLNTLMDYDMLLVMHQGRMVEYDRPEFLLNNIDSYIHNFTLHRTGKPPL